MEYKVGFMCSLESHLLCIFTSNCSADEWTPLSRNHALQTSLDMGSCLLYKLGLALI